MTDTADLSQLADAEQLLAELRAAIDQRCASGVALHRELVLLARSLPDGTTASTPSAISVTWARELEGSDLDEQVSFVTMLRSQVSRYRCVGSILISCVEWHGASPRPEDVPEIGVVAHLEHEHGARCYLAALDGSETAPKLGAWRDVTEQAAELLGALGRRLPGSYLN